MRFDRQSIKYERSRLLGDDEEDMKDTITLSGQMSSAATVSVVHQLATVVFLPFVHTACRYYRSNGLVTFPDRRCGAGSGSLD